MRLVYVVREENERLPDSLGVRSNLYKVGVGTDSAEKRIASLQTGNPRPITAVRVFHVPDAETAFDLETTLHNQNARFRLPGCEWFRFDDEQLEQFLSSAEVHHRELLQLTAGEAEFSASSVVDPVCEPDDAERERFSEVKTTLLEPKSSDTRERAHLDIQRRLFALRKVLLDTPSISDITLQGGSRRFDLSSFKKEHQELVGRFMRPGDRAFRWSFRAPPQSKPDTSLLDRAEQSVVDILLDGSATRHRAIAEEVHEALREADERDVMDRLHQITMREAHRKIPERKGRAWFYARVGTAAGINGICSCGVPAARVDAAAIRRHLAEHDPDLLKRFMQTGPTSIRISSPDGGVELASAEPNAED